MSSPDPYDFHFLLDETSKRHKKALQNQKIIGPPALKFIEGSTWGLMMKGEFL